MILSHGCLPIPPQRRVYEIENAVWKTEVILEVTPDFWIMPIARGLINKGIPARWRYQTNRILSPLCLPVPPQRHICNYFNILFPERQARRAILRFPLLLIPSFVFFARKITSALAIPSAACYDIVTYL